LSSFNLKEDYKFTTLLDVQVSDLGYETIIQKVYPAFIEKVFDLSFVETPFDLKNFGLNGLTVALG